MSKLIIYVSGKPLLNGHHIREFKWSEQHRKYLYLGREIALEEFNAVYEKAWRNNADLVPRVMVIAGPVVVVRVDEEQSVPPFSANAPVEPDMTPAEPRPTRRRGRQMLEVA